MKQQIYMPTGMLIFESDDKETQYDEKTLRSMVSAGYAVRIDGKKLRNKQTRSDLALRP